MTSAEINKQQLYNELHKLGVNGDYVRALKAANKILNVHPQDEKAFRCKIVCLLYLSRFEDALQAFQKNPSMADELVFEKAHCQYRLNKNQQALETLNSAPTESVHIKELKAQILYRLERYEECFQLYTEVLKNSSDEFEEERHTNLAAIIANLTLQGKEIEMPSFSFESYELVYNLSCNLIFKGQYLEAEIKLKNAEKLCREMFEDGSAEELEDDLAIMRLQLGYVVHMQGREKEAKAIYNSILKNKPSDAGVLAIACNNSVTVNKEQSLFDSKKKMKNALAENAQQKLFTWQNKQIAINNCLLHLKTGQADQALDLCEKLISKYPSEKWMSMLIKASIFSKENRQKEAISLLEKLPKVSKEQELILSLTLTQLLIQEKQFEKACKLMENLTKNQYKPAMVSFLASLYLEIGERAKAADLLHRAVAWHQENKGKGTDLSQLWRNAAELNLRSGQPEVAARSLEEVLKINPKNVITLAQLVFSYAKFNIKKAQQYCDTLKSLIDVTPNIDIDALEASNWMMGLRAIKKAAKVDQSPSTPQTEGKPTKTTKKKKKKAKFNPNNPVDPERWLPRYERSTYRKKKDRRVKEVLKGTQGSATGAADQYDITKIAAQRPAPSPGPSGDTKPQRKTPVQHKKKKKGSKW